MFPNLRISVDSFLLAHLGPTLSVPPLLCRSQLPPPLPPPRTHSATALVLTHILSLARSETLSDQPSVFLSPNSFYILFSDQFSKNKGLVTARPALAPVTDNALPTDPSLSAGVQDLLSLDLVYLLGKEQIPRADQELHILKTAGYLLSLLLLYNSLDGKGTLHFFTSHQLFTFILLRTSSHNQVTGSISLVYFEAS